MSDLTALIERIHNSPVQLVLVITGGGSRAISDLLSVPGASRTLLEARIPYAAAALADFLGSAPEHFCSPETARAMAATAYLRASRLSTNAGGATAGLSSSAPTDAPPLAKGGPGGVARGDATSRQHAPLAGVACTASLASDRPKKGPHRCHVACHDATSTTTYSLELTKGLRDRPGEEDVVARVILAAIARACDVSDEVPLGLADEEGVQSRRTEAPPAVADLFAGASRIVFVQSDGSIEPAPGGTGVSPVQIRAVLPGAFNPLHDGHRELARVAAEILGTPVRYEISLFNVDKPPLNYTDLEDRLRQFQGSADVVLTCAATFLEKARVLPGCTFVVGYDTAVRIVAPRYYGGEAEMFAALDELCTLATRFLVAGRLDGQRYRTLADITIPDGYADLFQAVPEARFRRDISSTELRAAESRDPG